MLYLRQDRFHGSRPDERPRAFVALLDLNRFRTIYNEKRQRRVTKIGVFTWKQRQVFLTEALRGETLGFEHVADGVWSIFFGTVMLGRFNEAEGKLSRERADNSVTHVTVIHCNVYRDPL